MRTKQVRPEPLEFEFKLNISKQFDDVRKKDYVLLEFNTMKEFENFAYKINVKQSIDLEKKELKFDLEGLSAPVISLSKAGNARYEYKFYDFKQTEYNLVLYKLGENRNLFKFKVLKNGVKLTREPSKKFIEVTAS